MMNIRLGSRRLTALRVLPLLFPLAGAWALPVPAAPTPAADTASTAVLADLPLVSPAFTDNMVLQRGRPAAVWGWTAPGRTVKVAIAGKSAVGVGNAQGKWTAMLPPLPVGGHLSNDGHAI